MNEKDYKGYIFDSLVYRFKDYQSKAFQTDVIDLKYEKNISELEARRIVKDRYDRDLIRFVQILNEAVGEHN